MKAIIFDSETTGANDPELIEAAWIELTPMSPGWLAGGRGSARFKPSKPIELSALSVHHIMDEDLANYPPSSEFKLMDDVGYLIGHQIDYDWKVIGEPDVKRICTLALARFVWPTADAHTQGALLYMLERERAREMLRSAHSATQDVEICLLILQHILRVHDGVESWEELWDLSELARVPTIMAFGKHKGVAIKDVPNDYKRWLLGQPNADPYLVKALRGVA